VAREFALVRTSRRGESAIARAFTESADLRAPIAPDALSRKMPRPEPSTERSA
jgi:hypothetical protein